MTPRVSAGGDRRAQPPIVRPILSGRDRRLPFAMIAPVTIRDAAWGPATGRKVMLSRFATAAIGTLALGGLTACGGGDEAFRTNFRTQALANCRGSSTPEVTAQLSSMGVTVEQLCTCAIDRYMRGASLDQLKADRNTAVPPALRNATMQ